MNTLKVRQKYQTAVPVTGRLKKRKIKKNAAQTINYPIYQQQHIIVCKSVCLMNHLMKTYVESRIANHLNKHSLKPIKKRINTHTLTQQTVTIVDITT